MNVNSALWARVNLALIAGITAWTTSGKMPAKYAVLCIVALAVLQSFLRPINQSSSNNAAAAGAVDRDKKGGM